MHVCVPLAELMLREGHPWQAEGHYLRKERSGGKKVQGIVWGIGGNVVSRV